jgi:hypothetical protein
MTVGEELNDFVATVIRPEQYEIRGQNCPIRLRFPLMTSNKF